jgi:hypothetical protein
VEEATASDAGEDATEAVAAETQETTETVEEATASDAGEES